MAQDNGPGTKKDDEAFDNSGQAFDKDIEDIYGTKDAEVEKGDDEDEDKEEG
jgi:hypothetical protein